MTASEIFEFMAIMIALEYDGRFQALKQSMFPGAAWITGDLIYFPALEGVVGIFFSGMVKYPEPIVHGFWLSVNEIKSDMRTKHGDRIMDIIFNEEKE